MPSVFLSISDEFAFVPVYFIIPFFSLSFFFKNTICCYRQRLRRQRQQRWQQPTTTTTDDHVSLIACTMKIFEKYYLYEQTSIVYSYIHMYISYFSYRPCRLNSIELSSLGNCWFASIDFVIIIIIITVCNQCACSATYLCFFLVFTPNHLFLATAMVVWLNFSKKISLWSQPSRRTCVLWTLQPLVVWVHCFAQWQGVKKNTSDHKCLEAACFFLISF